MKKITTTFGILCYCISTLAQETHFTGTDTSIPVNIQTMYLTQDRNESIRLHATTLKFQTTTGYNQLQSAKAPIHYRLQENNSRQSLQLFHQQAKHLFMTSQPAGEKNGFFNNRRNIYSGLWAFASLNYLYADIAGLMDMNLLNQYQQGVVDGVKITPQFLTAAAVFMQIPLSNVFLPQVIKNEKTLRWVQIASGAVMTLVQAGTLFYGKPSPYYVLFSVVEIAATSYITLDAIKWKPKNKQPKTAGIVL
jgi:hypothetical protein